MPKIKTPKIEELFDAGVHYGHQVRRWNPEMEPYIYTVRKNVHIINLELTEKMLQEAADFLYETASNGGQIIFVGTKRQARDIILLEAQRCGAKYVTERWLGGTITNFRVIKKNVDKLVDMMRKREAGEYQRYTKKERLLLDREIEDLQRSVGGIVGLDDVPATLFLVDTKREKTAVREAKRANVPVVALVDTNSDPMDITYPVPGNDDAIKSIALVVKTAADAVEAGYQEYAVKEKKAKKEAEEEAEKAKKDAKKAKEKEDMPLDDSKDIERETEINSEEKKDKEPTSKEDEEDKESKKTENESKEKSSKKEEV